jgi:hypothetical protein
MSSTARGSAFEGRVFAAIENELVGGRLGLRPESTRAFRGKGYHSRDRDDDILTDISLEVWLPGADRWSLLCVIECKDYAGAVPVSDVEEFKAKLDQISGANRKGIMAISGALQAGALTYARSVGIGIVRLLPDDQVRHVIYHMTATMLREAEKLDSGEFYRALTQPNFESFGRDFYAIIDQFMVGNWSKLLGRALAVSTPSPTAPPTASPSG